MNALREAAMPSRAELMSGEDYRESLRGYRPRSTGDWEHSHALTYSYATHHRHSCIAGRDSATS